MSGRHSLRRRGDMERPGIHAQLAQHAELVKEAPRLDNLSILNTVDTDPYDGRWLARGWDARQLAVMSSVSGPARDNGIPLRPLFVDREVKVGEGLSISRDEHLVAFRSGGRPRQCTRSTTDLVRGNELVEEGQVSLAKGLH